MTIHESTIAAVREAVDLATMVAREGVTLEQAPGDTLKGLCPFHHEKTPSFNVRRSHGTFHCFGCGEGGDVIRFVMKRRDVDFITAVEELALLAGIEVRYREPADDSADDPWSPVAPITRTLTETYTPRPGAERVYDYDSEEHTIRITVKRGKDKYYTALMLRKLASWLDGAPEPDNDPWSPGQPF